jgi:peptide chain release factor 1
MFDRLDDMLAHYEEVMQALNEPGVTDDQRRFRKLMKEQSDLAPVVETYTNYKKAKQDIEDSLMMLDEESDEDLREMAKEELNDAKKRVEELEQQLKILLLPKDPMIRTSSLRSAQAQAEMRRLCSQPSFTACM